MWRPTRLEGFDPRKQSWAAGALAAIETFAGAILGLSALLGAFTITSLLIEGRQTHPPHLTLVEGLYLSLGLGVAGGCLLWAGLSLMLGWQTAWRTQVIHALTLVGIATLAVSILTFYLRG
jgi:hypothetical protein